MALETNEKEPKVANVTKAAVPKKEKEKVKPRVLILGVMFVAVLVVAMVMYWNQSKSEVVIPTEESQTVAVKEKAPEQKDIKRAITTTEYKELLIVQTQIMKERFPKQDTPLQEHIKTINKFKEQLADVEVPAGMESVDAVYHDLLDTYLVTLRMTISADSVTMESPEEANAMYKEMESMLEGIKDNMQVIVDEVYPETPKQ